MSRSATCSDPAAVAVRPAVARGAASGLLGVILAGALVPPLGAQVLMTQEEALGLAFPAPAVAERRTAFLDEADLAEVKRRSAPDAAGDQSVVTYYVGRAGTEPLGAAYFDAHRVRTLQEVLMVVVDPRGRVARIEVLGFAEPPEYMAPDGWLDLFRGRTLEPGTSTRGDIPIVTGATLTSRAVSAAVRRSLALHEVIRPFGEEAGTAARGAP